MDKQEYLLVFCTTPNLEVAEELTHHLIGQKLAACVNIIPNLASIYSWQGKEEVSSELLLIIKTMTEHYSGLESALLNIHPYECPEIVAIPFSLGYEGYLKWINKTLSS